MMVINNDGHSIIYLHKPNIKRETPIPIATGGANINAAPPPDIIAPPVKLTISYVCVLFSL